MGRWGRSCQEYEPRRGRVTEICDASDRISDWARPTRMRCEAMLLLLLIAETSALLLAPAMRASAPTRAAVAMQFDEEGGMVKVSAGTRNIAHRLCRQF